MDSRTFAVPTARLLPGVECSLQQAAKNCQLSHTFEPKPTSQNQWVARTKCGMYMLSANQAIKHYWKQLVFITAAKDGLAEHLNTCSTFHAPLCIIISRPYVSNG